MTIQYSMGGISIKLKQILIVAIILTTILSLGCVSAADAIDDADALSDAAVTTDVDTAAIDAADDTTVDAVETEPNDISDSDTIITEDSDEEDLQDSDDVTVDSKSKLNANALGADDVGTFTELYNAIKNGGTVVLNKSYAYNAATDSALKGGMELETDLILNGNGHTIDGKNTARIFILNGYTTVIGGYYHGHTYTLRDINFVNAYSTTLGGAVTSQQYPNTLTISNCNFTNNTGVRGGAFYGSVLSNSLVPPRYVDVGSISITGCVFKDNYASDTGGAIYSGVSSDRSFITVNNNAFVNNTAAGAAKAIHYANANYLDVNYNWWGQNTWNNSFVAQSASSYITPTIRYQAAFTQTSGNTVKLTLSLSGGSAPAGSSLAMRNGTFVIAIGFITPESKMFRDSIEATYVALKNTTITAIVDNQRFTLNVSNTPRDSINEFTITVANVVLPGVAEIVADSDVNGTFNVTIGDTVKEITLTNGHGTLTWDALPAGQYFAVMECINNLYYNDKFTYTTFKVDKADSSISISASENQIEYGETTTITPVITPDTISADDIKYYVDGSEVSSSTLSDLSVGTHTVVAKYAGDDIYKDAESNKLTITVIKAIPVISISSTPVTYPNDAVIDLALKNSNNIALPGVTLRVTVNGITYAVVTDENGEASLTVADLKVGEYPIAAVSVANDNYDSIPYSGDAKVKVSGATPELVISSNATNIKYGEELSLSYTLTPGDTGAVTYYIDGAEIEGSTLSNLAIGTYIITAKVAADENYTEASSSNSIEITVEKATPTLTIAANATAIEYGQRVKLSSELSPAGATGDVVYYLDGQSISSDVLIGLSIGTHTVVAKYLGNENYTEANSNALSITVEKATPEIHISASEVTNIIYPKKFHFDVDLYNDYEEPIDGITVMATVNDKVYTAVSEEGEVEFTLDTLHVGTYTITVFTVENDFYNSAQSSITLKVNKGITDINFNLDDEGVSITYPKKFSFITFVEDMNRRNMNGVSVVVTVNGKNYTGITERGEVEFILDTLPVGTHTVTASTVETEDYSSDTDSFFIIVRKATLTIEVGTNASTITAGETIGFTNTINAPDGSALAGTVTYYLDGVAVQGESASVSEPGVHTVVAKYTGDDNFNDAESGEFSFTVLPVPIVASVESNPVTYPNAGEVTVKSNVDGLYIVTINEKEYEVVVSEGQGTTDIELLDAKDYTISLSADIEGYDPISIENAGTYTVNKGTPTISIVADKDEIVYGETVTITPTITPTAISADDISYYVDGNAVTGATLEGLPVGTHTVLAKYAASNNYNAAESNLLLITVNKMDTEITGEDITVYATVANDISFTLKDAKGNLLAGKTITIAFNGETYEKTTDENGVITLEDVVVTNKGTYSISASFDGDDTYESAFASYDVIVKAKSTKLTTAAATYSLSESKYLTATLTAGGQALANKIITFQVNGKTYTGRTNAEGVAKVAVSLTAKKTYSVVATFSGDNTYGTAVSTYKLKVI